MPTALTLAQDFTRSWEGQYATKASTQLLNKKQWFRLGYDALPTPLAVVYYDSLACLGTHEAMRLLQKVMNIVGEAHLDIFAPVSVDGCCSVSTLCLCRELRKSNLDFYAARMMVRHRVKLYARRCQARLAKESLEGWKARCQGLLEHLSHLEREVF